MMPFLGGTMGALIGLVILFALLLSLTRFMFTGRFTGRPGHHGRPAHHGLFGGFGSTHSGENPSYVDAALTAVLGTSLIFDSASLFPYSAARDAKHPSDFALAMLLIAFGCGVAVVAAFDESTITNWVFTAIDLLLCIGIASNEHTLGSAIVVVVVLASIAKGRHLRPWSDLAAIVICYLVMAHQEGGAIVAFSIVMTVLILTLSRMIWIAMKSVPLYVVVGVLALVFAGSVGASAI